MNIIGLLEMHPFDGTAPFLCLRVKNMSGVVFDLPITPEQLEIITSNMGETPQTSPPETNSSEYDNEEDDLVNLSDYNTSPIFPQTTTQDEQPIVLNTSMYSMGDTTNNNWDEDDDL